MSEMLPEIMSLEYSESDTGLPVMTICSEFSMIITNQTFLTSIITNTVLQAFWRFNTMKTGKLSFSVDPFTNFKVGPEDVILSLCIDRDFMGYVTVKQIYDFAIQAMAQLKAIAIERAEE